MRGWIRASALAIMVMALAVLGLRWMLYVRTQHAGFSVQANGRERPTDLGMQFEEFRIASGDRKLDAWWVPADPTAPESAAVLILHGNGESVSDWVPALALLHRHHLSTLIFDYSGFGSSDGHPSVDAVTEDGRSALAEFEKRASKARRRCVVGLSLGTAVAMSVVPHSHVPLDGVALLEPFASGRDAAIYLKLLPPWIAPLMPDAFDNVAHARELEVPLLIVHSRADETFPVSQSEKIAAAAKGEHRLVVLDHYGHPEAYQKPSEGYWGEVVDFVEGHGRERP